MGAGDTIAIGLSGHTLNAVSGRRDGNVFAVEHVFSGEMPESVDASDAEAVGAWLGSQLKDAGFPEGRATIALPREQLAIKRLTLPTCDPTELPDMTRLAMVRDLTFDATDAVIDFLPLGESDGRTTVLAVAAPRSIMTFAEEVVAAAGFTPHRVSLRAMGAATLARTLNGDGESGSHLIIDVTGRSVEFCIMVDGNVRFVRAAEFSNGTPAASANAVVTETRRTWMSYRMSDDAQDVRQVLMLGAPAVVDEAAPQIAELLNVPADPIVKHPMVRNGKHDLRSVWPLAGLLLESGLDTESIDVASPAGKVADLHAKRRQLMLAGIGAAVVVLATLFMGAKVHLNKLGKEAQALQSRMSTALPARREFHRDRFHLDHLERWDSVKTDWLEHMAAVMTLAPDGNRLVLDEFSASLDFRGVTFDRKSNDWGAPYSIKLSIDGEAKNRTTADDFRAALVNADLYTTNSVGADVKGGKRLPFGFTYSLQSEVGEPSPPVPETPIEATADRSEGEAADGTTVPQEGAL